MISSPNQTPSSSTQHKKKKRISKHVLKSQQQHVSENDTNDSNTTIVQQQQLGTSNTIDAIGNSNTRTTKRRKLKNSHVKDPEEAATYLNSWKTNKMDDGNSNNPNKKKNKKKDGATTSSNSSSSLWKFNKNTQSWLIRHMYECEKVSKSTFSLLLEYLEGLEGEITKGRIRTEATRRALRYKEYCSHNSNSITTEQHQDDEQNNGTIITSFVEKVEKKKSNSTVDSNNQNQEKRSEQDQRDIEEEENRWIQLSDNDKRKEYKRARKILDLVKAS
jgi:hypothetical protein